jgi:hypothetical protein
LGYKLHGVDTNVQEWVDPEDQGSIERANSRSSLEDIDGVSLVSPGKRSRKNSSPLVSFSDEVVVEDA